MPSDTLDETLPRRSEFIEELFEVVFENLQNSTSIHSQWLHFLPIYLESVGVAEEVAKTQVRQELFHCFGL